MSGRDSVMTDHPSHRRVIRCGRSARATNHGMVVRTILRTIGCRLLNINDFSNPRLITAGEDVCANGHWGQTPLHLAPDEHIARLLISHGADVKAVDWIGQTPLHRAKDEHIARLLISHGANVHAIDNEGKTPLHFARAIGIAKALIECEADARAVDNSGRSTFDSARKKNFLLTPEEYYALVSFLNSRAWSGRYRVRLRFLLRLNNVLEKDVAIWTVLRSRGLIRRPLCIFLSPDPPRRPPAPSTNRILLPAMFRTGDPQPSFGYGAIIWRLI
jgi:hypothetical protein